ncbi:MAG: hypothetical protein J6N54_06490, partial [Bacteroidales bacterium]|nr:hypothetical protein [Bacteroidales bacterium]
RENKIKGKLILHIVSLLVICAVFAVNYRAFFDPKLDPNGDNISYFLLAKALSEGQGYVDIIPPVPQPHVHFPPGYPMFMSVFMRFFPDNIVAMKILNGILFILAVLMLFRIIRKTSGGNIGLAFAVCLLTVVHPVLLRWSVVMMSEMLYIVISFGIILISLDLDVGRIFTKGRKDWRQVARFALLCLLVMSAYLVRTMGISVILAAGLAFGVTSAKYLIKKDKRWVKPAIVATAMALSLIVAHAGWTARNKHVYPDFKSDYNSGFMYTDKMERMTPGLWVKRISSNIGEFTSSWIPNAMLRPNEVQDHNKHEKPTASGLAIGGILILLMAFGVSRMKKGRVLILSYLLITFAVLMLYQEQYAGVRYFIPVLPLMFYAALNGVFEGCKLLIDKSFHKQTVIIPTAVALLAAALLMPPYLKGQKVYKNLASYKTYLEMNSESDFGHYILAAEWIRDHADYAPVIACRKPEIAYMYSGYSHAVRFPLRGDEKDILDFFKTSGANCLILDTWGKHAYTVIYPVLQAHPDAFPVYYVGPEDDGQAPTLVTAFLPSKLRD